LADLPADDPDLTSIRAAAAGDADAFEALVRRYEQRVVGLCGTLVGPEDGEDLAQEVFVRVYRALPSFRGESAFRTWLFRIAINVGRSSRANSWRRAGVWGDSGADETSAFDPRTRRTSRRPG
jgi:RNA polymerase sigma-70 factor (ECF subfamily)